MKKFFISLLIFFLTCITELSQLFFWLAVFTLACTWPYALLVIAMGGKTMGFATLFACVASIVVPLFTGIVFGIVVMALKRKS